ESENQFGDSIFLSHCWGGFQPLRTLKKHIADMKNCISWNDLPKTFQEAVTMTRRLGIRYLGIDSICIIQDDNGDWRRESSKMHTSYRNGYLTLSAAGRIKLDS
ncbi:heterokaryon incompatibility, partial [Ilyonectria destructans]